MTRRIGAFSTGGAAAGYFVSPRQPQPCSYPPSGPTHSNATSCSGGPLRNRRQQLGSRLGLRTHLLVQRHGKLLMCDAGMRRAGVRLLRHDVQVDPLQDVLLRHTGTKPTACLSEDASGIRQASPSPPRARQPHRPHTRSTCLRASALDPARLQGALAVYEIFKKGRKQAGSCRPGWADRCACCRKMARRNATALPMNDSEEG